MAPPIFPALPIGFSFHKKPTFATIVQTSVTGREVMSAQQAYPLWEFDSAFEVLRSQTQNQILDANWNFYLEFEQAVAAFMTAQGQANDFFYDDPSDDSRTGQRIGVGTGAATVFRIVRTWGFGGSAFTEPVGGINIDLPYTVYLNGTPTLGYTIDAGQQNIVFNSPVGSGVVVTADFSFFYRCRFIDDINDFEQFFKNVWLLSSLKFRSVKL